MKKLSIGLLVLILLSLAACKGKAEKAGDRQVTITLATSVYVEDPHRKAMDALLEAYKKIAPNVTIEIYGAGWSTYWDNVTTEIMGNNEADIMQIYPENVATYHNLRTGGVFVDLKKFMNNQDYVSHLTGQDMCEFDGEALALSNYAWGTTGLFYRKSVLRESGVDPQEIKTWNDFIAASAKLKRKGVFGLGIITSSHSFVVSEWARMLGRVVSGGLYFPNGEKGPFTADNIQVNNAANLWAARQWQDYLIKNEYGKTAPDPKDKREYFYNGLAAFCYDGPWFVGMIREYDSSLMDDVGIIPAPAVEYEGQTYQPNPTMYPLVMSLSKNCKNPDEAWAFMNWMTSDEAQQIAAECGMIPASVAYSTSAEYKTNYPQSSLFAEFLTSYAPQVADPFIPQQGELSQIMINAAQEMFASGGDCQAVLDQAAEKCKAVMSR
ncbi:MAG: sugar ABC transporter substrate-binding protein [Treponema sp.]|jgi:ABC-type glycerol-3-phosphate transport system substrate-binding protein|nr:sugar ABC transporter substrate-binding protein [Treponema sp.]